MRSLRAIGRVMGLALALAWIGQGTPSYGQDPAVGASRTAASVHHDRSAPVSTLAPVLNRRPPIPEAEKESEAAGLPPTPVGEPLRDTVVQTAALGEAPAPSASFDGIGDVDGYMPPDPNGDVGPDNYVQVVNDSFAVFDKQGGRLLNPMNITTLWAGFGGTCQDFGRGDPIVLYDPLADRFLLSQFAFRIDPTGHPLGPFYECVAVTQTADPTASWYRYAFLISVIKMNDYPKFGVWRDGYYMTVNQFGLLGEWQGVGVVAFDRAAMLEGRDASMQYLDSPATDSFGLLPADLDGATPPPDGAPEYLVGFDPHNWGRGLELWKFHVDWTNPLGSSFTGPFTMPTAPFDPDLCGFQRSCIPQPGTAEGLDANATRIMYRLAYRNFGDHESLVVNHTVDADGQDHAGVRWYEIRDPGGQPSVYQQGTFAPDANGRFLGSVAMDGSGDIGLGYSVSSPGTYPSIRYTGRLASDPLGELTQGEGTIVSGGGSQTHWSHRWGDYSSMSVDPSDDCTFWYTNEYYKSTNPWEWSTRIGSFRFPGCQSPPSLSVDDVAAAEGGTAAFTVSLAPPSDQPVTVNYATEPGTAGPADFGGASGTLSFEPGQTTAQISVPVLEDGIRESSETFTVGLSGAVGATIGRSRGTATIAGDPGSAIAVHRPDGEIRVKGRSYRGDGVYNVTGRRQTQKMHLRQGKTRRFFIQIHNDGNVRDRYTIRGPGSSYGFHVVYRTGGHRTITRKIVHGRYTIVVPPKGRRFILLVITVNRHAHRGSGRSFLVVTTSRSDPSNRDAVRARVRVLAH